MSRLGDTEAGGENASTVPSVLFSHFSPPVATVALTSHTETMYKSRDLWSSADTVAVERDKSLGGLLGQQEARRGQGSAPVSPHGFTEQESFLNTCKAQLWVILISGHRIIDRAGGSMSAGYGHRGVHLTLFHTISHSLCDKFPIRWFTVVT